jgi:hypothetical protein
MIAALHKRSADASVPLGLEETLSDIIVGDEKPDFGEPA